MIIDVQYFDVDIRQQACCEYYWLFVNGLTTAAGGEGN